MGEAEDRPDWRDQAAYAPLLDADRSFFAWEWLRRDAYYRSCARQVVEEVGLIGPECPGPDRFGLVLFEPPNLAVPAARPVWSSDVHPYVLSCRPGEATISEDLFDLDRLGAMARLVLAEDAEHLLLSDGRRTIRLDGPIGAFSGGPVCLSYEIAGLSKAEVSLLTLRRFLALCRRRCFARALHLSEARAPRWIMMLRTADALAQGADQREIAHVLLSRSVNEPRWRCRESSVRSQVQRLVRSARRFDRGEFWRLLK
jgi:hypothetical protein